MQENNPPEKFLPVKPLTKAELHETARERVSLIAREFSEGFAFLEKYPRSVTFFGGARIAQNDPYYFLAETIAKKIVSELGYAVLTGGGPGIMEGANKGAHEAGGASLGLTIEIPEGQAVNPYINKSIDFYYFFARKVCLSFSAEAFLFFPGGYGTLDEFFEIITLVQTHKIEHVPIILVGSDFWKPLEELFKKDLLSRGTIDEHDMSLYTITDDPAEIVQIIKETPVRNGLPFHPVTHEVGTQPSDNNVPLAEKRCIPCEGNEKPLDHAQSEGLLHELNQWVLVDDRQLEKTLEFKDFAAATVFMNKVAAIAEAQSHHPDMHLFNWNKVRLVLSTHAIKGLSENDFILAAKIDELLR